MKARGITSQNAKATRLIHQAQKPLPKGPTPSGPHSVLHPLRAAVLRIARAEIGTMEQGGNNRGERIREYQRATWLAAGPWPWCAAFVCWVIQEAIKDPAVIASMPGTNLEAWRPLTAGAFDFENWARSKKLNIKPEIHQARARDLIIFDFSHIGIVDLDQVGRDIYTIEGNTNGKGTRESKTGDGVWRKCRDYRLTKSYIELAP